MRRALLLVPMVLAALAGCSDGTESTRPQHQMIAAVRRGLYAVKAAPGGAIALFSDVRLYGKDVVCGTVDAQDGGGARTFAVVGGGEPVIEGSGDSGAVGTIGRTCRGPMRQVTGRNASFTDIEVEDTAH